MVDSIMTKMLMSLPVVVVLVLLRIVHTNSTIISTTTSLPVLTEAPPRERYEGDNRQKESTGQIPSSLVLSPVTDPLVSPESNSINIRRSKLSPSQNANNRRSNIFGNRHTQFAMRNSSVLQDSTRVHVKHCSIKVLPHSAKFLAREILRHKHYFADLELIFNNGEFTYKSLPNVIQPGRWVWTYNSSDTPFAYLSWPPNFSTLSIGLLDKHTIRAYLKLRVKPDNCSLIQGQPSSDRAVGNAMRKVMIKYLIPVNSDYKFLLPANDEYNTSSWCYLTTVAGLNTTVWYEFGVYMGLYVRGLKYTCCHLKLINRGVDTRSLQCNQVPEMWDECSDATFAIGFILFAFSPLILMNLMITSAITEPGTHNTRSRARAGGTLPSSGEYEEIPSSSESDCEDSECVYMDGNSPITVSTLICGFCGLSGAVPQAASRIRRFLFVLLCPVLVYINVCVLHLIPGQYQLAVDKVVHGIPTGLESVVAGYEVSRHMFMPVIGGPYVFVALYHVAGLIIVVWPPDLGFVLASGVHTQINSAVGSPLTLSPQTLEELSLVQYTTHAGYRKVFSFMWAQLYALLNPQFWKLAIKLQIQRGRVLLSPRRRNCKSRASRVLPKLLWFIFAIPNIIIYIVYCILEMICCLAYYGIPLISFMTIATKGFTRVLLDVLPSQPVAPANTNINKCMHMAVQVRVYLIRAVTCFLFLLLFYAWCFCLMIILQFSFNYMAVTVIYVFLAALVYPGYSVGYIFFSLTFLYYIWKVLTAIGVGYLKLLSDVVDVSLSLSREPLCQVDNNNKVVVTNIHTDGIHMLRLNNVDIDLTDEQITKLARGDSYKTKQYRYVHYNIENRPGIQRELFLYAVRKHKPVHIQVFMACLHITLIAALLTFSENILSHFASTSDKHVDGVMQVLALAVVGFLPRVIAIVFFHADDEFQHADLRRQLQNTLAVYWDNVVE
jgi:hypothetical protein